MRLTKDVRQQLLDQNEGFKLTTSYSGRNFTEDRKYEIRGGQLHYRTNNKTSWADSRGGGEFIADEEETHRFLYKYQARLNTDGLD